MKTYAEKLRDPRWQRKRLEIMQRDNFTCTQCGDTTDTQNVHHWQYSKEPWDAVNQDLTTVCRSCHKEIEKCKDLTKDFLRQSDFRMLLEQIERLLKNRAVKVVAFDDCVTVVLVDNNDYDNVIDHEKYRRLNCWEFVRLGDKYYCDDGLQVIDRISSDPKTAFEFGDDGVYRIRLDLQMDGYRYLKSGETIVSGDEFILQYDTKGWQKYGNAVGHPFRIGSVDLGRRRIEKNKDAMSIFDKLIANADVD